MAGFGADNEKKQASDSFIEKDGLLLRGKVLDKRYEEADGHKKEKHKVDVYCPGFREIFTISMNKSQYDLVLEGGRFVGYVRFSIFNDVAYWMPA